MSKVEIMNKLSRSFHKVGFTLKKHSPEILVVTGVVGTVVSAVLACKATTKLGDILETTKESVDAIHEAADKGEVNGVKYVPEDTKKDLAIVYTQTGVKLAKLYAPAVVLGAASITCILASNNILRKRNVALAAAYATVENGFKEYRNRVVERFGKDLDRELKYNIKSKEVEEIVKDENGKETVVKKTVETAEINEISDYARFFDETCLGWTKDAEYNLMYLKAKQSYFNERLRAVGHVFLNEVYEELGIPLSQAGSAVGWVYDESSKYSDNYIDFGIYNVHDEAKRLFVNGHERSILLDFNVDGDVWELMK